MTLSAYNPSTKLYVDGSTLDADDLARGIADACATAVPPAAGQLLGGTQFAGQSVPVQVGSGLSLTSGTLTATAVVPPAAGQLLGGTQFAGQAVPIQVGSGLSLTSGTLTASASIPSAAGLLLGGTQFAGEAVPIQIGAGLSLVTGTLTATGGGSGGTVYTFSTGLTNTSGTVTVNFGGLGSASTVAHSDHTHTIYAQTANNLSDVANAVTARSNLGLGNIATLAGTAQGQVAYYNGSAWTVLGAGSNGQVLTSGGVAANPSWTTVSGGAGSGTINSGTTNQLAYYAANGTVVSGLTFNSADFSISAGTISILGTATHGLSAGAGLAAGDEVAVWSLAANSGAGGDVKYTVTQTGAFVLSNWQSWVTGSRPSLGSNYGAGFNTTLGRFDFWNGSAWNQHARLTGDTFSGATGVSPAGLTDGATISTDASRANLFTVTLGGNRTLANPTNLLSGFFYTWQVTQDATGSRTLAYGNAFTFPGGTAPTLSTAASAVDAICCYYDGTKLRCQVGKAFA